MAATEARSYALFGSGEYRINDRLTAELGLRFTHESKEVAYEQTASLPIPGFDVVAPFERDVDGGEWSPTATLTYKVAPEAWVYGRVDRGFTSGGFNTGGSSDQPQM